MADVNPSRDPQPPAGGPPGGTTRGGDRGERAIAAVGRGIRGLGRWARRFAGESVRAWRYLDGEQRVAAVACMLLIVSTFGSAFSFVEAAVVLVALAVLLLLKKRADGRSFHLPFGDGAVILAAGAWSALLIIVRLFDRPLGQNLLALVCATLLALAGLRMRLRRPVDDLPQERARSRGRRGQDWAADEGVEIEFAGRPAGPAPGDATAALPRDEELTEALPREDERRAAPPEPPLVPPPAQERAPAREQPPAPEPPTAPEPGEQAGPFRARPAQPSEAPPPSDRIPRRPRERE